MTDLPDDDTIRVPRSGAPRDVAVPHRETFVDAAGHEQTDGSTIIARRESRRRAAREQAGAAAAAPSAAERTPPSASEATSTGRLAVIPEPGAGVRYGVRAADPVVVPRTVPAGRRAQASFDADASAAARHRRARRITLAVVLAAAAVVALAAVVVLAVILLGA